jgi:hypothetical protein
MALPITLLPAINSIYISDPNGLKVLGQSPYGAYGIQPWMYAAKYQSKFQFSDSINITAHIQDGIIDGRTSFAKLYLCDFYDPNSGDYRVYGATAYNTTVGSSIDLNVAPYLKGAQELMSYTDPFTQVVTPLKSYMWAFSFDDLSIADSGTYYLLLVNSIPIDDVGHTYGKTLLFSEPMFMRETHPNTLLFQSTFNTNKADNWNIIVTGWFNDYGAGNSQTYSPVFLNRVDGWVIDDDPSSVLVGYSQQLWEQVQTFSKLVRMKSLAIGELSTGIPPHMLEGITAQILADTFWINQYSYILPNSSNSTQLQKIWKSRRPNAAYPLFYAGTPLMERFQAQGAIITPPPPIPTHYFSPADFSDGFA